MPGGPVRREQGRVEVTITLADGTSEITGYAWEGWSP